MNFKPDVKPTDAASGPALWFLFDGDRLLTRVHAHGCGIPDAKDLEALGIAPDAATYLGALDGRSCFAAALPEGAALNAHFQLSGLRALFGIVSDTLIWVAGRANQLLYWQHTHRYCGKCGHRTEDKPDERAKHCPRCGQVNYPRLSPAVIVAVIREDRILLARNRRFKSSFYSVLAGFVEPGESLEDCVRREIEEEVGITVGNLRYFGSQPWPFPDSLMIAFVADYAAGEIVVDGSEIVEAAWFSKDELPQIPPKISIARQLIDWFAGR